jgi:quercetin dioxygenase-like cupin family protein
MLSLNIRHLACVAAIVTAVALAATVASSHDTDEKLGAVPKGGSKIAKIFEQVLPKGDYKKASVITVDYGPGGNSPKHRHDVAVFAYVLEGEIESQLAGEDVKLFRSGEMWYEPPGTVHVVSRNASQEKPAKLLVFFVQEEGKAATTLVK